MTRLSKEELLLCLAYLHDYELCRVKSTCVWFREAYFALVKSGRNMLIELASKKHDNRFPLLNQLFVSGFKNVEKLSKLDLAYQLPKFCRLTLNEVVCDISKLPKFEQVTELMCNELSLTSSYDREEILDWHFPNLKKLEMHYSTMKLVSQQLETLEVSRQSAILGNLVLPSLRELKVFLADFPQGLSLSNGLEKLEVMYPQTYFTISTKPFLTHLFFVNNFIPEWLLPGLTRLFPNLKNLELGTDYSNWQVDLRDMSSHPTLEKISLMSDIEEYHDVFGLENLSPNNFPCLSEITTTARYLDLNIMTPNPNLKKLVVGNCAIIDYQAPLEMKFPNLEIVRCDMCNDGDIPLEQPCLVSWE